MSAAIDFNRYKDNNRILRSDCCQAKEEEESCEYDTYTGDWRGYCKKCGKWITFYDVNELNKPDRKDE